MKLIFVFSFFLILSGCSFDDKSGIWKNENSLPQEKKENVFKDFIKVSSSIKNFDEIIPLEKGKSFEIIAPIKNKNWNDIFYNNNNNFSNYSYTDLNQIIFRSKKLSKYVIKNHILCENNNLILSDEKGNIIVYSINNNSIITKFNFYRKKFKNIKKNLNLTINENIIFTSDNFGYVYAFDYTQNKLLWAKNYKVPFRSNIKIFKNLLITSNQNNDLYIFEKSNGDLIKQIPTETTKINNLFINNISLSDGSVFFLNTYGSLYSINDTDFKLNWFINLNSSVNLNLNNLFSGKEIVVHNEKILVSSNENFYIINAKNGSVLHKKNFSSKIKPLAIGNYVFLITKNNLLIAMTLSEGEILYSYDINDEVSQFTDTKKQNIEFKNMMLVNNGLFIFLKNSFLIKLNLKGSINDIIKLPAKLKTYPIFIDELLFYLDTKNRLIILS
tara:strand:- start:298 stop:1626 length:1329 start_codon:yes stop_codon:yes gene_type:complete